MKNTSNHIKNITVAGIMAAMITVMTAYICRIPIGVNGGYVHFGDSLIFLAAVLLPRPYAMAAAAIGGGLADLLTAPMWAPATVIIKMLLTLSFTNKSTKIITVRNVIASVIGYLITGVGYFIAEYLIFGTGAVLLVSMWQNLLQGVGSALFFLLFGFALDKVHVKVRFFSLL